MGRRGRTSSIRFYGPLKQSSSGGQPAGSEQLDKTEQINEHCSLLTPAARMLRARAMSQSVLSRIDLCHKVQVSKSLKSEKRSTPLKIQGVGHVKWSFHNSRFGILSLLYSRPFSNTPILLLLIPHHRPQAPPPADETRHLLQKFVRLERQHLAEREEALGELEAAVSVSQELHHQRENIKSCSHASRVRIPSECCGTLCMTMRANTAAVLLLIWPKVTTSKVGKALLPPQLLLPKNQGPRNAGRNFRNM